MFEKYKYKIASATGIPSLFHYLNRKKPLILTYHGLYDGPHQEIDALPATFVHVDDFARQMAFIKKKYTVVSPQALLDYVDGMSALPEHAALVTFDDGYESFCRLAWPILKTLDIRAIVFVPTRYVEDRKTFWFDTVWLFLKLSSRDEVKWVVDVLNLEESYAESPSQLARFVFAAMKSMTPVKRDSVVDRIFSDLMKKLSPDDPTLRLFYSLTKEEIRNLAGQGMVFGGHTHSHTILSAMADNDVKNEILYNKQMLDQISGSPSEFFAYPNGGHGDFDERHKRMLRDAGYKVSFSLTYRRSSIREDTMNVSRINVNPEDTLGSFDYHNSGIVGTIGEIRSILKYEC